MLESLPTTPRNMVVDLGPARVEEIPEITQFHFWQGRSRRRYLAAVHDAAEAEPIENSVVLLVRVEGDERQIGGVLTFGALDALAEQRLLRAILASGASEVHVHLLARTESARAAAARDLAPPTRRFAAVDAA